MVGLFERADNEVLRQLIDPFDSIDNIP
jgi:hypothetical protein